MVKFKFVLLFCLLFMGIFSSLFTLLIPSVKGLHIDQEFTFETEEFFNYPNIPAWYDGGSIETYNTRLPTNITQIYNATYSFTGETGLEGDFISFIDTNITDINTTVKIIDSQNEHSEVLELYDNDDAKQIIITHDFLISQTDNSIEFWISVSDVTKESYWRLRDSGGTVAILMGIMASQITYNDGGWHDIVAISNNVWVHIRIEFDVSPDTYNIYINGIEYGVFNFQNVVASIDEFQSYTDNPDKNYYTYFDAIIGFSLDVNYSIGDNIVPYFLTETSDAILYEVDKNEFYYYDYTNPNFDIYANGDDNPSGWTDIENGEDNTNIYEKSASDNVVRMVGDGVTAEGNGLYQDFNQDYGNVNVTWNIDIIDIDNIFGIFRCNIHSSDGSLVVSIALLGNAVLGVILSHFDGSSYNTLQNYLGLTDFTFNVFIDYSSDTFIFNWYQESTLNGTYMLPLNINNKDGLGIVNYTMDVTASPPNDFVVDLDKVGVYVNGTSLVQDFAFVNFWNIVSAENGYQHFTSEYSFIEILSESDDLGYAFFTAVVPSAPDDFPSIFERESFIYNVTKGRQLQDFEFDGETFITGPGIRAFFTGRTEILNITYRSVIMRDDGVSEYRLEFDTSMDYTSYFYVSISGSLHFNHYVKDDSLEFIQATFDIINTGALNHSLVHDFFKSGISEAILRLNYSDDTSTLIYFENYPVHGNLVLPDKVLNQFIILVSDNNLYDNANTSGRIDTLTLQYIPDWTINVISVDFITALIPLMVIIIVSVVFGQILGKESIVPLMLIMSVLCFIVEILPFWLLFISITVFAGIIFSEKDEVS